MIKFENIQKRFNEQSILKNINFEIREGEIFVLLGASGCGKTTCLKMINRLEKPTEGKIYFKGEDIQEKEVIHYRRNIGYVLQNTGLFPHMTVAQNLSLLQRIEHIPEKEIEKNNRELMDMIGMEGDIYFDRYPYQLSGGQKQRVGVARAFALNPEVVLMDEPFSAVDPLVRLSLQDELLQIQKKRKKTIVFVTHDIGEAFRIGDRICLFHDKSIVQCGTPDEFLHAPATEYVKNFIGKANLEKGIKGKNIGNLVNRNIVIASPEESVNDLMKKLQCDKSRKVIVVDSEKEIIGMASLTRLESVQDKSAAICNYMWSHIQPIYINETVEEAILIMNQFGTSYIPVKDERGAVIGTVEAIDILNQVS